MLAAFIIICLVFYIFMFALCRAAAWGDRREEDYEQEKFKGYLYCDDDCYICGCLEKCKKAVEKEG